MQDITRKVIELAGGPAKLAKELGITSQAVSQWDRVPVYPVNRVLQIEELLDWKVTRYDMRPDIYWEPE